MSGDEASGHMNERSHHENLYTHISRRYNYIPNDGGIRNSDYFSSNARQRPCKLCREIVGKTPDGDRLFFFFNHHQFSVLSLASLCVITFTFVTPVLQGFVMIERNNSTLTCDRLSFRLTTAFRLSRSCVGLVSGSIGIPAQR